MLCLLSHGRAFMFKRRSQILIASFLLCDLFMIALAWCGAYIIRFDAGWIPVTKATPEWSLCWVNLPLVLLLAVVSFHFTGQYAISRLRRLREEVVGVVKGVALLTLLVLASTFFRHDPYQSARCHGPVRRGRLLPGVDWPSSRLGRSAHLTQSRL